MIRQICLLTKSYKQNGYCVAGIDIESREWIRLVSSIDPSSDRISKSYLEINEKSIDCFDIIEVDTLANIPTECQTENWLIRETDPPKYVGTVSKDELFNYLKLDTPDYFIVNNGGYLTEKEVFRLDRSLFAFEVCNLTVQIEEYDYFGDRKFKNKCSFVYNGIKYTDISLTDPVYRDINNNGTFIKRAVLIASLPCIPFERTGYYHKFIAKIIESDSDVDDKITKITARKEGFFYSFYDEDAEIVHDALGYNYLPNMSRHKTGFPVKSLDSAVLRLKAMGIEVVISDTKAPIPPQNGANATNSVSSSRYEFLKVLAGENVNLFTGEGVTGIDEELKKRLLEVYFKLNKTAKSDNWSDAEIELLKNAVAKNYTLKAIGQELGRSQKAIKTKITELDLMAAQKNDDGCDVNIGAKWTTDEEEKLKQEFESGLSISDIARMHKRNSGGIRARLKKLGLIDY